MGYVIQNRVNKKLEHRLRRFIEKDGSTRPFIDDKEFALYFRKTLRINDDNEFNYIDI